MNFTTPFRFAVASSPALVAAAIAFTPGTARAEEPAPSAPVPAPSAPALAPAPAPAPSARPGASAHDASMSTLRERLDEIEMTARVERAADRLEVERRDRAEPRPEPGLSSAKLRKGTLVLPDLAGLSSSFVRVAPGGVIGVGGLGGVGVAGSGLAFTGPLTIAFTSRTGSNGLEASTVAFTPSIDVFVTRRLTVGGRLTLARNTSSYQVSTPGSSGSLTQQIYESEGYGIGLAPRVGYVFPIMDGLLFWPQLSLGFSQTRDESTIGPRALARSLSGDVDLGLVAPLGRHVLFRVAPTVAYTFTDRDLVATSESYDSVNVGLRAQLGLAF